MAVVTFLSDFGLSDHYVAAVKASILKEMPTCTIVDISHMIGVGDIGHAAHLLSSVFRDFPSGSVHLIGISNSNVKLSRPVAIEMEGHFFVGDDSGIYSLLSDQPPVNKVGLSLSDFVRTVFPARDIYGPTVAQLVNGVSIQELGDPLEEINEFMPTRSKATKKQIAGNIVRIDHYGNLVTNILQDDFEAILNLNNHCPYVVNFRREKIRTIHQDFYDVGPGECFVVFDSQRRLQIGVLQGHGADLLGLMLQDQVFIDFLI